MAHLKMYGEHDVSDHIFTDQRHISGDVVMIMQAVFTSQIAHVPI
jgi:hypothetical protein